MAARPRRPFRNQGTRVSAGMILTVLILAASMAAIFAVVLLVTRRMGAGAEARADDLRAEVERLGEGWPISLQGATFHGAQRVYGRGGGNGVLGLTGRRVVFEPISGERISLPLARLAGARLGGWHRAAGGARRRRLTLILDDGNEVGFLVDDPVEWTTGLAAAGVAVEEPGGEVVPV